MLTYGLIKDRNLGYNTHEWQRSSVVDQGTHKPLVVGSNPSAATMTLRNSPTDQGSARIRYVSSGTGHYRQEGTIIGLLGSRTATSECPLTQVAELSHFH